MSLKMTHCDFNSATGVKSPNVGFVLVVREGRVPVEQTLVSGTEPKTMEKEQSQEVEVQWSDNFPKGSPTHRDQS